MTAGEPNNVPEPVDVVSGDVTPAATTATVAAVSAATPSPVPAKKRQKLPETTEGMPWASSHEIKKEPNAFTDGDWRNIAYAWAGMAVRLVIIFGSLFSVYQFLAARSEKKVEHTLQLVDDWERPEYQDAVMAINTRLAELNRTNQGNLSPKPSEKELEVYMAGLGIAAMKPDAARPETAKLPQHFDKVVYFLNRIAFCVEGNLCDDDVAQAYFKDYALSFWRYFAGYIMEVRSSGAATYAEPLEAYVRSFDAGSGS